MSIQNFEKLFEECGEHFDSLCSKCFKNIYKKDPLSLLNVNDPFIRRNNKRFLQKCNRKILGRSYKVHQQIRKLYQF